MKIEIEQGGELEVFGLGENKAWRVANDDFLQLAYAKAKKDSAGALNLASRLVKEKGLTGVIRFRCSSRARVVPLCM